MSFTFLVWAPPYTHRSAGVRALYRLCHHLNNGGYPSAMVAKRAEVLPDWNTPFHDGPAGDSIVIYPEIVSGNPLGARKVVRWALNNPGLLGGDTTYADDEMVFVFNPSRLKIVSRAANVRLGKREVLSVGLVDPAHIYPDPAVARTIDCSFTYKGSALRARFPLPKAANALPLEKLSASTAELGDTLRRTRTLYSYDHASLVLREAAISGCDVRVVGEDGQWHDPQTCRCAYNIHWPPRFKETYAAAFHDRSFVEGFVRELRTRWRVPGPGPWWRLRRFFR